MNTVSYGIASPHGCAAGARVVACGQGTCARVRRGQAVCGCGAQGHASPLRTHRPLQPAPGAGWCPHCTRRAGRRGRAGRARAQGRRGRGLPGPAHTLGQMRHCLRCGAAGVWLGGRKDVLVVVVGGGATSSVRAVAEKHQAPHTTTRLGPDGESVRRVWAQIRAAPAVARSFRVSAPVRTTFEDSRIARPHCHHASLWKIWKPLSANGRALIAAACCSVCECVPPQRFFWLTWRPVACRCLRRRRRRRRAFRLTRIAPQCNRRPAPCRFVAERRG